MSTPTDIPTRPKRTAAWERRLRAGSIEPDRTLDLHGMTMDSAWTAIDVASSGDEDASVLVLEHTSGDLLPPFNGPGSLRRWDAAGPTVLTNCLARPTSMARDERDGVTYITELLTGRVVMVP